MIAISAAANSEGRGRDRRALTRAAQRANTLMRIVGPMPEAMAPGDSARDP